MTYSGRRLLARPIEGFKCHRLVQRRLIDALRDTRAVLLSDPPRVADSLAVPLQFLTLAQTLFDASRFEVDPENWTVE